MTLAPAHGARFELARVTTSSAGAVYRVSVLDAHARHEARVSLEAASLEMRWVSEPPPWIAETVHGFVKILQKNHAHDGSWPARLVRWRSERT